MKRFVQFNEVFSASDMKKAIKIARESGGDYDKAFAAIEKIKKGLGSEHIVANALKKANESIEEVSDEALQEGFDLPAMDYNKLKDYKGFQDIKIKKMIKANDFSKFNPTTVQDIILWLNMVAMQWKAGILKEGFEEVETISEGKAQGKIIKKMMDLNKALMKEVDNLSKIDDGDLHDQLTNMDHFTTKLRDTILRANKVNPK